MALRRRLPVAVMQSFCVTCGVTLMARRWATWSCVIGLIFAHRDAAAGLLGFGLEHDLRSAAFGRAVGERDHAGHRQPMPVLHGGVAHVAELRLAPGGLAVESAVGIAGARMRVVFALLAVELGPAIVVATAVLGA